MKIHSDTSGHELKPTSEQEPGRAGRWRRLTRRHSLGVAVALMIPALAVGLAACGGSSSSTATTTGAASTAVAPVAGSHSFTGDPSSGGGSNARSTDAAGGSVGTVTGVSAASFTVSTPTGGKVTVKERSSTVYDRGTNKSTASAVTKGRTVLVLGKVDSTTITASQVIVRPAINLKQASAHVISFKDGTQGKSKSVGQIPADYTQGSGKLVSGTKAAKATEAALKQYAGGVVDRVVQLGNGDYEVHNIGVNWPHHVFVNHDFKVIGAND
jgi:hypothetical protein